jgi:hypothetical protein
MLGLLILFALVLATAACSVARQRQRAFSDQLAARLEASASRKMPAVGAESTMHEDLPAPVLRNLRLAVTDGVTPARLARFRQAGTLRTDTRSNRWMSFTADHRVAPAAAGFVWQAQVALFPGAHLRVRDSLVDGRGEGPVNLMSALVMSAAGGNLEMNSGSLHRFLAEGAECVNGNETPGCRN